MAYITVVNDDGTEQDLGAGEWDTSRLYSRGQEKRRVMFLELMVWAIHCIESIETRREWEAFTAELVETRKEVWGDRPWPKATDNDAFLEHVRKMAHVFANSDSNSETGVLYDRRETNPLASAA